MLGAQSLSGRFSTSIYSWERQLSTSDSETHAKLFQTAQLTVGKLAGNRLSLHLYGVFAQDLAVSAEEDPALRLYNSYLQWKDRTGILERVRVGRQRIYSGVAYGTIDGIDAGVRVKDYFKIGGFAGALVPPANDVEVGKWDDAHAFGLRLSTSKLAGTRVLVSFMQRNRTPVAYSAPGRYTGRILKFDDLEQRLVGLDVQRRFSERVDVYGRLDYDIEQERLRRGQLELRLTASDKLNFSGEFVHRAPLLAANSIFSVFEQNTMQDLGLRASYRISPVWFLSGNFGVQVYEGDESLRFGLGLRGRYGSFGYNFRRGYAGQNNGAYASLTYPLTPKMGLVATTGFSRYSLFSEDLETQTSLTGSLGLNYRPHKLLSLDVLGQGVRNRFDSHDVRLFIKANYWFHKR